MKARTGKIARLPKAVRDRLNQRLADGESGEALLEWLHSQPEVLEVLVRDFERRPILKQNLSEWRMGGFRDWEARQERLEHVRRSGTLMYEAVHALTNANMGQSSIVGIGGDPILGTSFVDVLMMLEDDPETERVVLMGEIGGRGEAEAAEFIKARMTKPVFGYIAGQTAPPGVLMGHAGAIIVYEKSTARAKVAALRAAGVRMADNPQELPELMRY